VRALFGAFFAVLREVFPALLATALPRVRAAGFFADFRADFLGAFFALAFLPRFAAGFGAARFRRGAVDIGATSRGSETRPSLAGGI
jgi:hypothetical protein